MDNQKTNYLLSYFQPTFFSESIDNIDIEYLKNIGIKTIFCDLDNTLVPYFCQLPNNFVNQLLKKWQDNFQVFIISNNNKKRVSLFCELLNVNDFVYSSHKPFTKKVKRLINKHNLNKNEIIFIGDQFITDVLCANRLNIKSILILPKLDIWKNKKYYNSIFLFVETIIYKLLTKNKLLFNENYYDKAIKNKYDSI